MTTGRLRNRIETAETKNSIATGGIRKRVAFAAEANAVSEMKRLRREEGWTDDDVLVVFVPATGRPRSVLH